MVRETLYVNMKNNKTNCKTLHALDTICDISHYYFECAYIYIYIYIYISFSNHSAIARIFCSEYKLGYMIKK